jgi:hypothetical protein
MWSSRKMIKSDRCSKTDLSRTDSTAGFHDEAFTRIDIFSQGRAMGIKERHIERFERGAEV